MISAVECREHAVECRQMSERAPSPRVRDILIDMARGWEGWRSKLNIMRRQVPNLCCAINFDGSCRRRAISSRMDSGGREKKLPMPATDLAPKTVELTEGGRPLRAVDDLRTSSFSFNLILNGPKPLFGADGSVSPVLNLSHHLMLFDFRLL